MASAESEQLCSAAERGDVADIERLVAAGADPDADAGRGRGRPLRAAASNGHGAAIAALLAAGALVNAVNSGGRAALMYAAFNGYTAVTAALLAAGADVHLTDESGDTALHDACARGSVDSVRMLLEAGARMDGGNQHGKLPADVVRACARTAAAHSDAPRCLCCAQVWAPHDAEKAAVAALLATAAPWSRRRPVAVACYGVEWEFEA
jgi:ankyrin repeat protein